MRAIVGALGVLALLAVTLSGCGRPGGGWSGPMAKTQTSTRPTDKPSKPFLEWGPAEAKVRLIGFFYISKDPKYVKHVAVFESLAKQYPTQLYVKYWDLRTPEGSQARAGAGPGGVGLFINGKASFDIKGGRPYTADFSQKMGRYWTEADLRAAIAQAVKQAYGK